MFGVERDLMKMTVLQLKEELEARGASRSGALKTQVGAPGAAPRHHHRRPREGGRGGRGGRQRRAEAVS